jgi:hypothetical protein
VFYALPTSGVVSKATIVTDEFGGAKALSGVKLFHHVQDELGKQFVLFLSDE